ncbi:MAG: vitamin K epoxide reductase family protein [bacterium]|nr:vitamin K epoxide reductase family protein [bacterium]
MPSSARRLLAAIVALSGVGIIVSGYGLWQHYAPVGTAFCNISERFSCDIVNKSQWSEFFGIPVAAIGIVGFLALVALALVAYKHPPTGAPSELRFAVTLLLVLSLLGLIFQAALTAIELFIIGAACLICLTSQAIILGIAGCAIALYTQRVWIPADSTSPPSS